VEERDIAIIRALQSEDAYFDISPFKKIADKLHISLPELLEQVERLKGVGVIRRFGAAMTPHKAGFNSNAMVTWNVSSETENESAEAMAAHPRVSHCYLRDGFEGFPFTLYTMVHANSPEELEEILNELSELGRVKERRVLKSVKEYKKSSPVYFPSKK